MMEIYNKYGWNLQGMQVTAGYLDGDQPVSGVVVNSRVQYGGKVSHTILLDDGFNYQGIIFRDAGETVNVDEEFINSVSNCSGSVVSNSYGKSISFQDGKSALDFFGEEEYTAIKNGTHSEYSYMEV
tara:strand:- start:15 stop:395 length:381 start_codon:yes stop_codon:yes gene_type:complete